MSRVIEKDQERAIDLLNDEIRFKNLQRKNFYGQNDITYEGQVFYFHSSKL